MNILHIASFNGNIGDHANHSGFRRSMKKYISDDIQYTELEIREFYRSWGMRHFDDTFVQLCNQHDLIVFGGGNFCELCWDYSATGTTLDISSDILNRIEPPILFNGMGVDDKDGQVNKNNIIKFESFLQALLDRKSLITVRNDGSWNILKKYYSKKIIDNVLKIPDGGFFVQPQKFQHVEIPKGKKIIAINLAGDSSAIRFSQDGTDGRLTMQEFIEQFASCINRLLEEDNSIHIVMTAHILQDFNMIVAVLANVKDIYIRSRISTTPYLNGSITDGEYIIDLYRNSALVIGMRYHANICAIAVKTPTIGIVNFPKHKMMYEDIGLTDRVVASDEPGFEDKLYKKVHATLSRLGTLRTENEQLLALLESENQSYITKVSKLF